jgi:polyphosphate kinase
MARDPKNYLNRELSWLAFNSRVLEEAQNERHPLLERLKFLAIYGTNLDEFYMVRVAGLQEMYKLGINAVGLDGMTPSQQLTAIREYLHAELPVVQATYTSILAMLAKEGLVMLHYNDLSKELQAKADAFFFERLYPVLVPIAIDSTHPFPHLNSLSFGLAVKLVGELGEVKFGLVRIPRVLPRFIEIEPGVFVITYSIVRQHIGQLFFGYELSESIPFRVTRNADMEIEEEEAEDFLEVLEQGIRSRRKGSFVRVQIASVHKENQELREFLMSHVKIDRGDIYRHDNLPLDSSSLWQIVGDKAFAHLTYKQYMPRTLPPLEPTGDIFDEIDSRDIVFYQPYESFDPVV